MENQHPDEWFAAKKIPISEGSANVISCAANLVYTVLALTKKTKKNKNYSRELAVKKKSPLAAKVRS